LPDALQIDAVEKLRAEQDDHINSLLQAAEISKGASLEPTEEIAIRAHAMGEFDEEIKKYLERSGIDAADPQFDTYASQLRDLSIDKIDDVEWNDRPIDPSDSSNLLPSPRMKAVDDLRSLSATVAATPPTPDAAGTLLMPKTSAEVKVIVDNKPEIIAAREKVKGLREKLAKLTAQRQSKLFSRSETKREYADVQTEYQAAVNELARAELKAEKDEGLTRTEEDERLDATFKLMEQYQGLQADAIAIMKDTKASKFINYMTEGGVAKRIAKGVVLGVVGGAVVAATAGTVGGAAGAAILAGGGASIRAARHFARFDNDAGRGMNELTDSREDVLKSAGAETETTDKSIDLVHQELMKRLEQENTKEQEKRRKSTYKTIGVVAISAAAVEGAHLAADAFSGYDVSKVNDWMPWNKDDVEAKGKEDVSTSILNPEEDAKRVEEAIRDQQKRFDSGTPYNDVNNAEFADARTISPGEGFYQTFADMDIPPQEYAALLDKVGPELSALQVDGQSFAYKMPNGEWGMRMTPGGKMPPEALEAIAKAHEQMSGAGTSAAETAASATGDTPAATKPEGASFDSESAAADTPATPESINDTVDRSAVGDVLAKSTINPSDITNNSQLMELSHVSTWYPPESLGQKLHLPASEWNKVQDYITAQTEQDNRLYTNAFEVQNGYLKFTNNRIPADTMADILNHIPPTTRSRYGLTA
jgi:hypothetical protein